MAKEKKAAAHKKAAEIITGAADATSGMVVVANYHTGRIMLPRKSEQGVAVAPLILEPGRTNLVPAEEWEARKKSTVVQHYLDHGIIGEVRKHSGDVPIDSTGTSDLDAIIPENLQATSFEGNETGVQVSQTRENAGEVAL